MKLCLPCNHENPDNAQVCEECQTPLDFGTNINETTIAEKHQISFVKDDLIANRYQVLEEIGRGGMGVVYKVSDTMLGSRQCALKLVHPDLVANPEARRRFEDEVAICLDMHHQNIIQVYHMDRVGELLFFTMEYLQGTSLAELLEKAKNRVPPFSIGLLKAVIIPLLDGLSYAHTLTIHRDIKPDNIMVLGEFPDISIKILDFGIARTMSTSRFTQTAQGMGTPYYMAPEQLDDAHEIDLRADLYSVGMVLYEMLTGEKAIGRFELPSELLSEGHKAMDQVIIKSLSSKAERRYGTAAEFSAAFVSAVKEIEQREEKPLVAGEQKRAEAQQCRETEAAKLSEEERKRQKKVEKPKEKNSEKSALGKKGLLVVMIIVGGVLLSGGGYLFVKQQPVTPVETPAVVALPPIESPAVIKDEIDEVPKEISTGRLTVYVTPSNARIKLLDGPSYSPGLELENGSYKVRVTGPGYISQTRTVVITANAPSYMSIDLEKEKPKVVGPYTDPITGMEFVYVKGGCYQMGDTFGDGYDDEKPVHEVCVDGYHIGKYEVTQGEYTKITGSNPSTFKNGNSYPVETVSWDDARSFVSKLNSKSGNQYRLPTEAEWEYAAREGGKKVRFGNGQNSISPDTANFDGSSKYKKSYSSTGIYREKTTQVGFFSPNSLGLYDMSGNVWEWCSDWYGKNYYKSSPRNNPQGASSGSYRVIRGGSWGINPRSVRAANRDWYTPGFTYNGLGFRLVFSSGQQVSD